MQIKD